MVLLAGAQKSPRFNANLTFNSCWRCIQLCYFMTANLPLCGVHVCVTVAEGDSLPMKLCSRSVCQTLALHQRQKDGDRKRKTWKHDGGMETRAYKAYGLCEETDVSVWRGEVSTHILLHLFLQYPHGMSRQMCGEDVLACWDSQSTFKPSLMMFPLLLSTHHPHHLLFISSSQLTFTIPPELLTWWHLMLLIFVLFQQLSIKTWYVQQQLWKHYIACD